MSPASIAAAASPAIVAARRSAPTAATPTPAAPAPPRIAAAAPAPRPTPVIRTVRDVIDLTARIDHELEAHPSLARLVAHQGELAQVEGAIDRRIATYQADNDDWATYRGVPSRERPTDLNEDPVPMEDVYQSVVPAMQALSTLTALADIARATPRSRALRSPALVERARDALGELGESARWI